MIELTYIFYYIFSGINLTMQSEFETYYKHEKRVFILPYASSEVNLEKRELLNFYR